MRISVFLVATLLALAPAHAADKPNDAKVVKTKADTAKAKAKAKKTGWCEEDCGANAKVKKAAPRTQK